MSPPRDHRARLLAHLETRGRKGLEIGALTSPVLRRGDGDVLFADHLSTEGLRARYATDGAVDPDALVEVDVVTGGRSLREALGARVPVDYIVASHVIEHLADPVGWLRDLAGCLAPGGHLCLAVPDKRFTFDRLRGTSRTRELIEAHLAGAARPTPGQVYDQVAHEAPAEPGDLWRGRAPAPPDEARRRGRALALAQGAAAGQYHDVHCTVWTPASFAGVLADLMALDLLPFSFVDLMPTRFGRIEFYATLLHCPDRTPAQRAASAPRLDPALHDAVPRGLRWRAVARRLGFRRKEPGAAAILARQAADVAVVNGDPEARMKLSRLS